jgi:FkbM family methyltransferase
VVPPSHHPVFEQFQRWSGNVPDKTEVNFVGQIIDRRFEGHENLTFASTPTPDYPELSEETFEWITILQAVLEAQHAFTMIELGAGYGRWLLAAACAARRQRPDLKLKLIGVEAEPLHFQWMRQHFIDNRFDPDNHDLIQAAMNKDGGETTFIVGHAAAWYGQAIVPAGFVIPDFPEAKVVTVSGLKLSKLLERYGYVDLIDMDIQSAEAEVVPEGIEAMTRKVRRAFVATHSADIHKTVADAFTAHGWTRQYCHGWISDPEPTDYGPISFQDGVQTWINPAI